MNSKKPLIASLATLATAGVICGAVLAGGSAGAADTVIGAGTVAHASPPAAAKLRGTTAPGGSASAHRPNGAQADKATQVHMNITNNTDETMTLTSATDSGTGSHWQNRATDLAPGQNETVSNYAAGDAQIDLTYTGASTGSVIKLHAETPLVGSNSASGSSSNTSYTVDANAGSGYNPTDSYSIKAGHTFTYTGKTDTYTVPAGVTKLNVTAIGGAGGDDMDGQAGHEIADGAQITGTMNVTPGEVLTVGVGGHGYAAYNNVAGGWGMTTGSSNYAGGQGYTTPADNIGGGGGATVLLDGAGSPVVVAGGAGGTGAGGLSTAGVGGRGGYQGSLTGENGGPYAQGGKAGANTESHGQDATSGGGAGGGGVGGGLAGNSSNQGGGAGSSLDNGLTGPTVQAATSTLGNIVDGEIVLSATS